MLTRYLIALIVICCLSIPVQSQAQDGKITVIMATELGDIEVVVDPVNAPITTTNFLKYVDEGQYDGGIFHRTVTPDNQPNNTVKIEVIQGAVNPKFRDDSYPPKSGYPPIELERTNKTGLKHLDGTISMARSKPNTATSGIFICIGAQPELDFGGKRNPDGQGFAAFGQVIKGMDVVKKIQLSPRDDRQSLKPAIKILSIKRQ
jgi:peptidyl-prolyl cis-trans isomerase A (cyclophilin A)